ncbi:MAG: galactokinase [Acidimicrobiales bacterium]
MPVPGAGAATVPVEEGWSVHPTRRVDHQPDRQERGGHRGHPQRTPLRTVRVGRGPGRVNLMGDHTDYNEGVVLPMAIDRAVTVELVSEDVPVLEIRSDAFGTAVLSVDRPLDDRSLLRLAPAWVRLVAAMVDAARYRSGGSLHISSSLPAGSGLSSSAALSVALAQVFGVSGSALQIARMAQRAENRLGVPVGLMDPWASAGGRRGHALLIDCSSLEATEVAVPSEARIVVFDSGRPRSLGETGYAERVRQCRAASALVGPLGLAEEADLEAIRDPILRRRARHVVTECGRVRRCAAALERGDLDAVGALMRESHRSLSGDFEVSTPELDRLVELLGAHDGVHGARLTGAGFGGCVVAISRPGALDTDALGLRAWEVRPADGMLASSVP